MQNDFKTYLVSYNHDGAAWGLEIKARSMEDAQARLRRLAFARLDGEVKARIPVPRGRVGIAVGHLLGFLQDTVMRHRT